MNQYLVITAFLLVGACSDPLSEETLLRSREMPQWFEDAKLGVFIHWGPATVPAFAYGPPLAPGELDEVMFGDSPRKELPYAEGLLTLTINKPLPGPAVVVRYNL